VSDAIDRREPSDSLFQEGWWLDLVAPGQWAAATVEQEGRVIGRLPYVLTRRLGLRLLSMPRFTKALGPIVRVERAGAGDSLAHEQLVMDRLIDGLPHHHWYSHLFSPTVVNWYPFYLRGFHQRTLYTYRLDDLSNRDRIWSSIAKNLRRDIRQAEQRLSVRTDLPIERLHELMVLTYRRQGRSAPAGVEFLRQLDRGCRARGAGLALFAEDAKSRVHAAAYVVYDARCAYWLLSGSDLEGRSSGAGALLIWHAIRLLSEPARTFDFEGSMIPGVARFYRRFGAQQVPYFHVWRARGVGRAAAASWGAIRAFTREAAAQAVGDDPGKAEG